MDDVSSHARYYANSNEQKILIQGLKHYFSLPERSQNRNKVAKDFSNYLRSFSPHWTHRAVRLWFNNNRHTYLPAGDTPSPTPPPTPPMPPPPPAPKRGPIVLPAILPMRIPIPPKPTPPPVVTPPVSPDIKKPVSYWQQGARSHNPYQCYVSLSATLNEIRRMPAGSPKLPKLVADFDSGCHDIAARNGRILPDKIEPMCKYVTFDFPRETPPSLRLGLLNSESTSDLRDLGFCGGSTSDVPNKSMWLNRPFADETLKSFTAAALDDVHAAFTFTDPQSTKQMLSVMPLGTPRSGWRSFELDLPTRVEAMCVNGGTAWLLSNSTVCKVPLDGSDSRCSVTLACPGGGTIAGYHDGAVVSSPSSNNLFLLNNAAVCQTVRVPYKGVLCASGLGNRIVCSITDSGTMRLVSPATGAEERVFVGHCGQVMGIEWLAENKFASRSDDGTVRVWDVRDHNPCATLLLPHVSVLAMAGSENFLMCGFHNKCIGVVDLRNRCGQAMFGVQTQDYVPCTMRFTPAADTLAMFGVLDKFPIGPSSMVFVDQQGQQRVFREYSRFIGGM